MLKLFIFILSVLLPTICYAGGGDFAVTLSASRISGVAPLSVFFDVTSTPAISSTYHQSTCYWQFDTTRVDTSADYQSGSGFVAAHVFENPGTYTVRVDIYTPDQQHAWETTTITVNEFSGTTYYVANDGDNANLGTSTLSPFLTPEHALSSSILGPNVRVLFKNGDTFTISNMISIFNETGPIIIGGYSDPAEPSDEKPIIWITATRAEAWNTIFFWNCSDIRIMAIAARATAEISTYPHGIGQSYDCTHMLKYRTEEYKNGGLSLSPSGQYSTIAECVFHDTTETGYTSNASGETNDGNALIGNAVYDKNLVDQNNEEHIFRLQGGSRYYIAHNTFGPDAVVNNDILTIRGDSEKIVIYKNTIYDYQTDIQPQNTNSNFENQHHCIIDSNLFIGGSRVRDNAISLSSKDIVIRNNIIYNYQWGIAVCADSVVGDSTRIDIENNTMINPTEISGYFQLVWIDDGCTHVNIKNNVMLDEAGIASTNTRFMDLRDSSTFDANSTSNYNRIYSLVNDWTSWGLFDGSTLSSWQFASGQDTNTAIINPAMLNTTVNNRNFYKFKKNSPLYNSGTWTPAALDFHGNFRDSSRDIGAIEYNPSDFQSIPPAVSLLLLLQ